MTHFHASITEDDDTVALGGPFPTRQAAQTRLLVEAGSIAGRPSWALTDATLGAAGIDVVEFYNSRSGSKMTLRAWGCTCEKGERNA